MDCCSKSIYHKVITIAVVQLTVNGICLVYAILGLFYPADRDYMTKYYKFPYKNVENYFYCVFTLLGVVFGFILLFGSKKKSGCLCKWWMGYAIITYLINRFDSCFAVAAISLDGRIEFVAGAIIYASSILAWFGYSIWTVYKFMLGLEKDPEIKGTGFYGNMGKQLPIQGPDHYKAELPIYIQR